MRRSLIVSVVLLCSCSKPGVPLPTQPHVMADHEWIESMKWWPDAIGYAQETLGPQRKDNPELDAALSAALKEKDRIWKRESLSKSCKWYYDRIYDKTPAQVIEASRREKWGQ